LISVDELRAAGALDVPPHWRKTLGAERELPLFADQDLHGEDVQESTDESDADESTPQGEASADDLA